MRAKRLSNALEQRKGVSFIVCIFQTANSRCRSPDARRKFSLGKPALVAQLEDLPRNSRVEDLPFILLVPFGVFSNITIMEKLKGAGIGFLAVPVCATPA